MGGLNKLSESSRQPVTWKGPTDVDVAPAPNQKSNYDMMMMWVQAVCKDYQQTTKVPTYKQRANRSKWNYKRSVGKMDLCETWGKAKTERDGVKVLLALITVCSFQMILQCMYYIQSHVRVGTGLKSSCN